MNGEQEQNAARARSNKLSQVKYVTHVVCIMRLKYPDCDITYIRVVIGFDHAFTEIVVFVCTSQYRKIVAQ